MTEELFLKKNSCLRNSYKTADITFLKLKIIFVRLLFVVMSCSTPLCYCKAFALFQIAAHLIFPLHHEITVLNGLHFKTENYYLKKILYKYQTGYF